MISKPYLVAASLLAPVLVFSAGYLSGIRNQRTEIKTEYKDRVVYQDRVIYKEAAKERTKFKEKEVVKPDGTRITERSGSESKSTQAGGRRDTQVQRETTASSSKSVPAPARPPDYAASINIDPRSDYRKPGSYSLGLGRRIAGPVWVEGMANSKGGFTLGLRVEW